MSDPERGQESGNLRVKLTPDPRRIWTTRSRIGPIHSMPTPFLDQDIQSRIQSFLAELSGW